MDQLAKPRISLDEILSNKDEFLEFEQISTLEIVALWKKPGDVEYDEVYLAQKDLPYRWEDPLYMKMIHRFRNCANRIAVFFHQIDPGNQHLLLRQYLSLFYVKNPSLAMESVDFMAWISNMLGIYEIKTILDEDGRPANRQFDLVELWRVKPISFFYSLSHASQTALCRRYNRDCIDSYNNHFGL